MPPRGTGRKYAALDSTIHSGRGCRGRDDRHQFDRDGGLAAARWRRRANRNGFATGATLLQSTGAIPFASLVDPSAYSGTLTSAVYTNDPGNSFGANRLTFTFLLSNNANSRDAIERFVANNYVGLQVDAAVNAAGGGRSPSTADRQATGISIGFDYTNTLPIAPGTSSTLLVLHTNATQFVPVTNSIAKHVSPRSSPASAQWCRSPRPPASSPWVA
jgi:hypothetical protein